MKRRPEAEEARMFREAIGQVKPIAHDRHVPARPQPPPRARSSKRDRGASLHESVPDPSGDPPLSVGDELVFRRAGVQSAVLRKLRRGQYRIQGEIDLHGLTLPEADQALRAFLADAQTVGAQCLRVVHGKGLRSGEKGPVIKNAVNSILRRTDAVLAFVSARQTDGGTGAVYILLSKTIA